MLTKPTPFQGRYGKAPPLRGYGSQIFEWVLHEIRAEPLWRSVYSLNKICWWNTLVWNKKKKNSNFCFSNCFQDLQEVTHEVHYENYRSGRLAKQGGLVPPTPQRKTSALSSGATSVHDEKDKQLQEKEAELRRMQEMVAQMQAQIKQQSQTSLASLATTINSDQWKALNQSILSNQTSHTFFLQELWKESQISSDCLPFLPEEKYLFTAGPLYSTINLP